MTKGKYNPEARRRYDQSEKGKAAKRRHAESAKGKETRRRYKAAHRAQLNAAWQKWAKSPAGRATRRAWANTPERRAYKQQWMAARRQLLNEIKLSTGCMDCGYADHPAALEFDHRDPTTKRFDISKNPGRSWNDILTEIEKCDVRCANCHRIRSIENGHHLAERQPQPVVAEHPRLFTL